MIWRRNITENTEIAIVKYSSIIMLILYFMQGVFYPNSSFLGKISLAGYLAVGLYCIIRTIINKTRQPLIYISLAFLLLNFAYFGFSNDNIISSLFGLQYSGQMKYILLVFVTIVTFFYLTRNKAINEKNLLLIYGILYVFSIINFYELSPFSLHNTKVVNNVGYSFVNLLPFLFLIRKKYFALILCLISTFIVISSLKRGAIAILAIFMMYYIFTQLKEAKITKEQKISLITLGIILCGFATFQLYQGNEIIQERINQTLDGNSSGRDTLYGVLWENWKNNDSAITVLFGNGFAYTPYITGGLYAHNDWLELLTNLGLIGVGLYVIFYTYLVKFALQKDIDKNTRRIAISASVIMLLKSFFSMSYVDIGSIPLVILLGYVLGKYELQSVTNKEIVE